MICLGSSDECKCIVTIILRASALIITKAHKNLITIAIIKPYTPMFEILMVSIDQVRSSIPKAASNCELCAPVAVNTKVSTGDIITAIAIAVDATPMEGPVVAACMRQYIIKLE